MRRKPPKPRSPAAAKLANPRYRAKVIRNRKVYRRKGRASAGV